MSQIKNIIIAWRRAAEEGLEYHEIIDLYPTLFQNEKSVLHDLQQGLVPAEIEAHLHSVFRTAEINTWRRLFFFHKRELHDIHILTHALEEILLLQADFHKSTTAAALALGVRLYTAWLQKTSFQSSTHTIKAHLLFSHVSFKNHPLWKDLGTDDILNTPTIAKALPVLSLPTPTFPTRSYRLVHLVLRFKICHQAATTTISHTLTQLSTQHTI